MNNDIDRMGILLAIDAHWMKRYDITRYLMSPVLCPVCHLPCIIGADGTFIHEVTLTHWDDVGVVTYIEKGCDIDGING